MTISQLYLRVLSKVKRELLRVSPKSIKNKLLDFFINMKYKMIADKDKVICIKTSTIEKVIKNEIEKKYVFGKIMNGDWDLETKSVYGNKYNSINQHYLEGVAWEDTSLFENYRRRLKKEKRVLGCTNIEQIKNRYEKQINNLFNNIKKNGFLLPSKNNPNIDIISIYIDRNGDFLYTDNGNHRLAIANILDIKKIPVQVKARHTEWQKLREWLGEMCINEIKTIDERILNHPDLQDILERN